MLKKKRKENISCLFFFLTILKSSDGRSVFHSNFSISHKTLQRPFNIINQLQSPPYINISSIADNVSILGAASESALLNQIKKMYTY